MEQAQICKLNSMTFNFDIDLEFAWQNDGFLCTISLPLKFNENISKCSEDMDCTRKTRVKLKTLFCDIDLKSA